MYEIAELSIDRGYGGCGWPLLPADLETIGLARDQRPATSQPATTQSSTSQTQTNDAPFQACTVYSTCNRYQRYRPFSYCISRRRVIIIVESSYTYSRLIV